MKPAPFTYHRPRDVKEAIALLRSGDGDTRLLAGGQSLVPMMNFRIARPSSIVDLADCDELYGITVKGPDLCVAAMTSQRDAERNELVLQYCPLLSDALAVVGNATIRNRGTIGGSIANAYPMAQLLAVTVSLQATMVAQSNSGQREISANDFYQGAFQTALAADEVLTEIRFPLRKPRSQHFFDEVGNHAGGTAQVVLAGVIDFEDDASILDVRLVVLGLATTPFRLRETEASLIRAGIAAPPLSHAWKTDMDAAKALSAHNMNFGDHADVAHMMVFNAIKSWNSPTEIGERPA